MNLTWKQLENVCVYRMRKEEARGFAEMKRASVTGSQLIGRPELNKDCVDFQGKASGVPFKMECKICSVASFQLREIDLKRGQYEELCRFDGVAFVLLHFNPRRLTSRMTEAETFAIPVWRGHEFWERYESGEAKSISKDDCRQYGKTVKWNTLPRCRKLSPDIVEVIERLKGMLIT